MNDLIQSYYQNPVHNTAPTIVTISHHEGNSVCGDSITIHLLIEDNIITDRGFTGDTSLITTAASGFFGDLVIGQSMDDVLTRGEQTIIEAGFEVSTRRRRARIIALMATQNAIYEYQKTDKIVRFDNLL